MSPDLWVRAATTIVIVAIVCGSAYRLIKMYIRGESGTAVTHPGQDEIHDRLERLQQSVDAIAVEVERLSEGQRFTTKLLAERERNVAQISPAFRDG